MADNPKGQSCKNCLYYREGDEINNRYCVRNPPQWSEENEVGYFGDAGWREDTWCGEWAPANPDTVDEAARTLARFVLLGDLTAARALVDRLKETV